MSYRKILPGDPLVMSARMFNDLIDVSKGQNFSSTGIQGPRFFRHATCVLVQNNSGEAVDQFGILGIDDTIIGPDDNLDEFQRQVTFAGVTPLVADHLGKFVVLLEPLDEDAIGWAVVSGVVQVQLSGNSSPQNWADVDDGQTGTLAAGTSGGAQILWAEDNGDDETQWALVRIGNTGGSIGTIGWLKRTTVFGSSFDFIFAGAITIGGSGSATITPVPTDLNYMAGDTILISDGSGNTETGTVTSYGSGSLNYTITGSTGSGTISGMRVTATSVITTTRIGTQLYAATLYDLDFNAIDTIWVSDPNGFEPTIGVYYMCEKGKPIRLRQLWWINRSGPVVLEVACPGPNSTFGAAL